jgi:hypothetical protein
LSELGEGTNSENLDVASSNIIADASIDGGKLKAES